MISFVIPAHNAGQTIARTLKSVCLQTSGSWEVIVIDDGSTDETPEIVRGFAAKDSRVRLVQQANGGASKARNVGLTQAAGTHVTFLDADDTIAPTYAERMVARLGRDPDAEGVCCGSERRSRTGDVIGCSRPDCLKGNPKLACRPGVPAPIHALLVSRSRLVELGGFDERLRAYEDWDLWIRMVLANVRIVVEPRVLVTYWSTPGSISRDGVTMIRDHGIVSARSRALTDDEGGSADADDHDGRLSAVLWNGGVAIGTGCDWAPLAANAPKLVAPSAIPHVHAGFLLDGLCVGAERPVRDILELWPRISQPLQAFLKAVETRSGFNGLGYHLLKTLEKEAIRGAALKSPQALSRTMAVPLAPNVLMSGVAVVPGCDSVIFKLGSRLLEVPSFSDLDGAAVRSMLPRLAIHNVLRSAAGKGLKAPEAVLEPLDRRLRPLVRRLKQRIRKAATSTQPQASELALQPALPAGRVGEIITVETEEMERRLKRLTPDAAAQRAAEPFGKDYAGNFNAWDEFFEQPDPWEYDKPYEQIKYDRTLSIVPNQPLPRALELACAEGRFTERLAARADYIRAVDISKTALARASERCARFENIEYLVQDFFEDDLGSDWNLITCCEVLYYMNSSERLAPFARRVRDALAPGGYFIQTHASVVRDDPGRSGFDWAGPFGADVIADTFETTPGLRRVRTIRTELYRVDLFQREGSFQHEGFSQQDSSDKAPPPVEEQVPLGSDLEVRVARQVIWNGVEARRDELWNRRAFTIPVLMYHRIADDGPPDLAPYRVTPKAFEQQLLFLRRRGFRSATLAEWKAGRRSGSLEGRPVLITFDDAYVDFHESAWPLLKRYDFTAHVFVPTDKVGGTADWDLSYGEAAPIMPWKDIARLALEGVTFGSHLASHPWATCLPSEELLREAARSRAALETVLGQEITSVAPPFGATNARIDAVLRLAGYRESFLDHGGPAQVWGLGLSTPRIEVRGGDGLDVFAANLGVAVAPPSERDRPPQLDAIA